MIYKQIPVSELREHPQNKKYFSDIESTSKSFWREFVTNIENIGIIEALVVNEETMEVISGNQRLKAAREIGLEAVPCILCKSTDPQDEIRKMISSNVMRRELDPITLFEYIGILRAGYDGAARDGVPSGHEIPTRESVKKQLGKRADFISAADIYNSLSEKQQKELQKWFHEQDERPTDAALIKKVKELEHTALIQGKQLTDLNDEIRKRDNRIEELKATREDHADELRQLRREIATLKKSLNEERAKDELQHISEVLGESLNAITDQAAGLATSLARFRSKVEKSGIEIGGIQTAIAKSKLVILKRTLDEFFDRFGQKALEGGKR